jgi:undecaprenyl-diphosphatase
MLFRLDDHLFHLLYGRGGPLEMAAVVLSALGEGWSVLAILPLALSPRTRRFAAWLFGTLAVTAAVVFAAKALIGRGRPFVVYSGLRRALLDSPTDYSLPSGHAAGSFAFALFVTHVLMARRPRPAYALPSSIALVLLAACIGVSRVVLGFHFPLDVAAGATLGSVIGGVAGRWFTRSAEPGGEPREAGEAG